MKKTETLTSKEYQDLVAEDMSETEHQKALIEWAEAKAAEYPALRALYHIPNGGARSAAAGARLKDMGTKAGMPDLCLPVIRSTSEQLSGALYIELKKPGGSPKENQIECMDRLWAAGNTCVICQGWEEARTVILDYLNGKW